MNNLHIQSLGDGPDLVLIHGWGMHGGIFHDLCEALAASHRVHIVDLPGHGFNHESRDSLELAATARRLSEQLPAAIWIGWSLGGLVAMHAAIHHPTSVRALAVIAASPCFVQKPDWQFAVDLQVFTQFGADLQRDHRETLERFLALEVHGDEHALSGLRQLKARLFERGEPSAVALQQGLSILADSDLRDQLEQIRCPNVWIAGARDRLVPSSAMSWSAQTAGGQFHRIARAGHAPFLTHQDEVLAQLQALHRSMDSV